MRCAARPALLTAALLAVVLAVAGCGGGSSDASVSSKAPTDHVLHLAFLKDPGQPPDPDVFYSGQGLMLTENLYEGLLQYQPGTDKPTIVGSLASAFTASPDNTTFTLTLRSGVTFHDGTTFDSSAVKASFDRRLAVNSGPAYMVSTVTSVETPSPTQVVIHLSSPNAAFLSYLASPYGPRMMSPTALAAHAGTDHDQKWLTTHDVGTGPYTLTKAAVGQDYQMKAYDKYWGGKPYFTSVDLPVLNDSSSLQVQFNQGTIAAITYGLSTSSSVSYQKKKDVDNFALPDLQTDQVYLNSSKGYLTSQTNRMATLQAINTATILKQVFPGRAQKATGNYPKTMLPEGASPQSVDYDPSKLKAVVASLPADQKKITIGYDSSNDDQQTIANLIAADVGALGLTATVQALTTSTIFGYVGNDPTKAPNILVAGAWPDSAEAYTWAHIIYDGNGGLNYLGCHDDALTKAIADGIGTSSTTNPSLWGQIGVKALDTGCWFNTDYRADFMVGHSWLSGVEQAHVITAPTSLLLNKLSVKGS